MLGNVEDMHVNVPDMVVYVQDILVYLVDMLVKDRICSKMFRTSS